MQDSLVAALKASRDIKTERDKKLESQINIVARIMAKRELAEQYLSPDFEHMQAQSWWIEPLFYYAFMFLLALQVEGSPPNWAQEMKERGKAILEKEKGSI